MKKPVIICVDDEKLVLDSIKTELKNSFGNLYTIETAENGDDALEIIREMMHNHFEIPLIISDYIMPKIKGDELLKEVHQILPNTLKILLTGQATLEGVTNSINHANLYRYIAKPWEPKDLELTVNEAVKSYLQGRQLEEQNIQLRELNHALEIKVKERTAEIHQKNQILEQQKNELYQTNVNITASINYARRIQQALLPSKDYIDRIFPESFIIYKPKDIVSGDFYWAAASQPAPCKGTGNETLYDEGSFIAVADCTGHGVPGALMSMLGMSFLSEIVNQNNIAGEALTPAEILDLLKEKVKASLKQTGKDNENKDGMDIAICWLNKNHSRLQYAGAFNPLIIIRNINNHPEIIELKADRMPIGIYYNEKHTFTNHEIEVLPGDMVYLFTDGYIDQFGGEKIEKFKISRFRELLKSINPHSFNHQKEVLENYYNNWKSQHEQIDDVTIVGFKI